MLYTKAPWVVFATPPWHPAVKPLCSPCLPHPPCPPHPHCPWVLTHDLGAINPQGAKASSDSRGGIAHCCSQHKDWSITQWSTHPNLAAHRSRPLSSWSWGRASADLAHAVQSTPQATTSAPLVLDGENMHYPHHNDTLMGITRWEKPDGPVIGEDKLILR